MPTCISNKPFPRVLMVTSEWPTQENPISAPFVARQVSFLKKNGIDVDVVHVRGKANILNYLRNSRKVRKIMRTNSYDLIHAQWAQSALTVLPTKLPLVVTYRGDDIEGIINAKGKHGINSIMLRILSRMVSYFSDYNIVVSSHMIPKLWGSSKRVCVIPSGIDFSEIPQISKQDAKLKWGFPSDKKVVIFPNNIKTFRKRFDLVKASIEQLPDEYKNKVELKVVYGFNHNDLLEQMIASDILLFTSMHEGSPNVVKEAMACNLPIVSVNVADVKERIGEISGCFVVNSYNSLDLSAALTKALDFDYSNYNSSKHALNLDENKLVQNLINVYKSLTP